MGRCAGVRLLELRVGISVSWKCRVLSGRADPSSRGVLPSVMCVFVWSQNPNNQRSKLKQGSCATNIYTRINLLLGGNFDFQAYLFVINPSLGDTLTKLFYFPINPLKIKLNFNKKTFHHILTKILYFQTFYDVVKPYKNQFHGVILSVLIESCL
jgi:hypothetical protein